MVKVIGVRFRRAGKLYYFSPGALEIKKDDQVIVETARGVEIGKVVESAHEVDEIKVVQPLKEVIRLAEERDIAHLKENEEKQKDAFRVCKDMIREHGLEMKLISCEYTFDNSKILFYFTADGRIDFRELVKDLAGVFRTRIELRQVGVRDETKLLGGIGICGRTLCCHSYLSDFIPVSIKMAKEQSLSLNPTKISGVCGRLMCCLKNEEEVYEELNSRLPRNGDYVTTPDGLTGEVQSVSILKQTVKAVINLPNDEKEIREYPAEELSFRPRRAKGKRGELPKSEKVREADEDEKAAKELEHLDRAETQENTESGEERKERRIQSDGERGRGRRQDRRNKKRRPDRGSDAGGGRAAADTPKKAEESAPSDRSRRDGEQKEGAEKKENRRDRQRNRNRRRSRPEKGQGNAAGENVRTQESRAERPNRSGSAKRSGGAGRSNRADSTDRSTGGNA